MALEWVRNNACVKGKPNMTAAKFCSWVNCNLLPKVLENHASAFSKISVRTARRWLHKLGFEQVSSKKGIYIDGHERTNVVEYRKLYLKRLDILASTHLPPPLCSDELSTHASQPPLRTDELSPHRELVLIFHDKSIYHSNDDQGWMWGEKGKTVLKPKGQGWGICKVVKFYNAYTLSSTYNILKSSCQAFLYNHNNFQLQYRQQQRKPLKIVGIFKLSGWRKSKFL